MTKHKIDTSNFEGVYEHTAVFVSSHGSGQNKCIEAIMIHNWNNDKTSFTYRVTNKDTIVFESTSLQKAIAEYNKI